MSVKAIRHYEAIGLCVPQVRTESGYRIYTPEDLVWLQKIRHFRELGFSLQQIPELLALAPEELRSAFEERLLQVEEELNQRKRALSVLKAYLSPEKKPLDSKGAAIITIDLQNDLTQGGALACSRINCLLPRLKTLFAAARERGIPVIYISDWHTPDDEELLLWNDHMIAGSWGAEIIPEVAPEPGDHVIHKNRFNGFLNTDLQKTLDALNVRTLVMTGWRTDVCVAQTAIEAFYRGYRVILAEDGIGSTSDAEHNFGLSLMQINYAFDSMPCDRVLDYLRSGEK